MSLKLIFEGKATLEDLLTLNALGYEFVVNNGMITHIIIERGKQRGIFTR